MNPADIPEAPLEQALERIRSMPAFLEAALHEALPEEYGMRPSDEAFSLVEHACHLRDLEREGYLVRVRRILGEDRPALASFDGAAVARARDYPAQDAKAAAREFAAARGELLGLLAASTPAALAREATFEGKTITLRDLVSMIDAHDGEHRAEIERLLDDLED